MQIQVNTDSHVKAPEEFLARIKSIVESTLSLKRDHITGVDIHMSDESCNKNTQNDNRCVMEARIIGHQPIAVSYRAETIEAAIDGAAEILIRLIDNSLTRLYDQGNRSSDLFQVK